MLARTITKALRGTVAAKKLPMMKIVATIPSRNFAHHAPKVDEKVDPNKIIEPELFDTLEWVLDSPPNVHQFEEPPIVVEIEHLKHVITADDH
mmetsp:Transcript_281/g.347  ORF Transcript_281/g.347 Transcript_281/m.347 type:complete len:93 (-) Transcript_281:78-356(-)